MAEAQEAPKPKKDLGGLFLYGFIGINLIVLLGGAGLVYMNTLGYKPPSFDEEAAKRELASFEENLRGEPVVYHLETVSTNLDGFPRRLIRVDMTLEMLDDEGFEEIMKSGALARDAVIRVLNSKNYTDIASVQGKLQLKNHIITQLNGLLEVGVVKNVYFKDFVVQ